MNWALAQPACSTVTAWTEKFNIPSHRVLEKIGMVRGSEENNKYYWYKKGGGG